MKLLFGRGDRYVRGTKGTGPLHIDGKGHEKCVDTLF